MKFFKKKILGKVFLVLMVISFAGNTMADINTTSSAGDNNSANDYSDARAVLSANTTIGTNTVGQSAFNNETDSGDNNSNNNSTATSTNNPYGKFLGMAGSATTSNLTTSYGQDLCMGSWTAGVSAMGMGLSGGSTLSDNNCERLRNAKLMNDMGLKDVAMSLMCEDEGVRMAMKIARPAAYNRFCAKWDLVDQDDYLEEIINDEGKVVTTVVLEEVIDAEGEVTTTVVEDISNFFSSDEKPTIRGIVSKHPGHSVR